MEPGNADLGEELRDFRSDTAANVKALRTSTTASFNAIREDFVDLRDDMNRRFGEVDRGFTEMRGRFDATAAGQQQIVDMLQSIISNRRSDADE
jgi:hypothetical protein